MGIKEYKYITPFKSGKLKSIDVRDKSHGEKRGIYNSFVRHPNKYQVELYPGGFISTATKIKVQPIRWKKSVRKLNKNSVAYIGR